MVGEDAYHVKEVAFCSVGVYAYQDFTPAGGRVSVSPFGVYLREKRTATGRSLRSLAEALGITHVYLGEVERGRRRTLPEKYWQKLAEEVPGITLDELEEMATTSEPIDPAEMDGRPRDVVVALARTLEEGGMSDDVAEALLKILSKKRNS